MSHARSTVPESPVYHEVLPKRHNVQEYLYKLYASEACYIHYLERKKKKKRLTYGTCAHQFNIFVLINYNKRVALLTGLTNWLPWGK